MSSKYGRTARSSAFQWFAHRVTGTFLVFLLITHFWVQHYSRTTASVTHSVVTSAEAADGEMPAYPQEAVDAVRAMQARQRQAAPGDVQTVPAATPTQSAAPSAIESVRDAERADAVQAVQAAQLGDDAPPGDTANVTPYEVLMLRLGDPVYAVLWKGFNLLFLAFALHHGFYGLNNVLTDYVRNDMLRVGAVALSWTVALVLFVIGAYSVIVAGL